MLLTYSTLLSTIIYCQPIYTYGKHREPLILRRWGPFNYCVSPSRYGALASLLNTLYLVVALECRHVFGTAIGRAIDNFSPLVAIGKHHARSIPSDGQLAGSTFGTKINHGGR